MLSLCLHGPQSDAPPWSHLSPLCNGDSRLWLSGGGGAVRAPDLGGGEETALAGGKSLFLSRRVPHSPSRRPASLSCFCFPSLRWKRRPASLFPPHPSPRAGGGVAGSLGSSPGLSSLLFPLHWVLPISGPRGGDGVPRDLVLVSHNPMPVWAWAARPPCAGPVSPCVPGRGPGPAHYYSPESCVTDSPKPEPTHFPFLGPAQASSPQVSRRERLGSGWLPQSPLWFHPPSLGTQPWAEEEKPCILLLSPWNVL